MTQNLGVFSNLNDSVTQGSFSIQCVDISFQGVLACLAVCDSVFVNTSTRSNQSQKSST